MTEVTRVPLLPIQRGSLAKLWLGAAALALAGAGLAWAAIPHGIQLTEIAAGEGASPAEGQVAIINYVGKLEDGKVFDQAKGQPMLVGNNIPGFDEALRRMKPGGKYRLVIPADKAYGDKANGPIPANSELTFDVELLAFMPREEFEARMQMMQQMMQGGAPGAPGAAPGAAPPVPMPGQ